jgi:hypothetical protein
MGEDFKVEKDQMNNASVLLGIDIAEGLEEEAGVSHQFLSNCRGRNETRISLYHDAVDKNIFDPRKI